MLFVVLGRAFSTLLFEFIFGSRRLGSDRLSVRVKGVDKSLLLSLRGKEMKAFVDGSVLSSGACGFAVFYSDDHPLNFHGGFAGPGESNLAELAAVFWALCHHPRGQQLNLFCDSEHALRVVHAVGDESAAAAPARTRTARSRGRGNATSGPPPCPRLDERERPLARAIYWLLRLRTAKTCFYKVPGHRGFTQNQIVDALAHQGAEKGPSCEADLPLKTSLWGLLCLLLHYLIGQSGIDGGAGQQVSTPAADPRKRSTAAAHNVRRPQPLGPSTDVTDVLALDCEMVGVGPFGVDSCLASVSVVNDQGNQIFFSYAKPSRPVTDYRTKYSGVERHHLENAPPVAVVQQQVRRLIDGHVIVGHSLENDFRVLGFSPTRAMMRDTAHDVMRLLSRSGRPRKLRRIAWEFLGLVIQDSEAGHDPLEDARAALLLYLRYREEFEARAAHHAAEASARAEMKCANAKNK